MIQKNAHRDNENHGPDTANDARSPSPIGGEMENLRQSCSESYGFLNKLMIVTPQFSVASSSAKTSASSALKFPSSAQRTQRFPQRVCDDVPMVIRPAHGGTATS